MRQPVLLHAVFGAFFLLAGCNNDDPTVDPAPTPAAAAHCDVGDPMVRTDLFFGLDRGADPSVTGEEWQGFVDTVVTPLFKDGLTEFDAGGQYLAMNGELIHEGTKVIMLLHDGSDAASANIDTLRSEYKTRFEQESVLRVDFPACISF